MSQSQSGYVDVGDGKVYYERAGQGKPVVFVHAGIVDGGMWDSQWEEFSRHYSVIRYDTRGVGRSDPVENPVSPRQDLYRVLEHAGVSRATLVGCSLGGETILDAAVERPDLVSELVVVSTAPGGFDLQGEPPRYVLDLIAALQAGDLTLASELQVRVSIDGPYREPEQVDPQVRQRAAEMNLNALTKGSWLLNAGGPIDPIDPPVAQRLDQIAIPTLIVAGGLDHPEILRAAETMASGIPGAQKVIMPGCAHLPNMEQPENFNRIVLDFLRSRE